jgi:MarR family transcriptional regulator for hemolysin
VPRPTTPPIGPHLTRSARAISRAFEAELASAGGSLPAWLIMISLKSRDLANQQQLADAVGIRGATLTHHLNALEAAGLVERQRDPANRRIQQVRLTEAGDAAFHRMRAAAVAFDRRLRTGITDDEVTALTGLLDRLVANTTTR